MPSPPGVIGKNVNDDIKGFNNMKTKKGKSIPKATPIAHQPIPPIIQQNNVKIKITGI